MEVSVSYLRKSKDCLNVCVYLNVNLYCKYLLITKCADTDAMERSGLLRNTSPNPYSWTTTIPLQNTYTIHPYLTRGGEVLGVSS